MQKSKIALIVLSILFVLFLLTSNFQYSRAEECEQKLDLQYEITQPLQNDLQQCLDFKDIYCHDFNETTDVSEIRDLAENYLVAEMNNAKDIVFEDIFLIGDNCNGRWWVAAKFQNKIDDTTSHHGHAFMTIDAVTKNMKEFSAHTGEHYSNTWKVSYRIGETKHEAGNASSFP